MQVLSERIRGSMRSFGQVFANRDLRRLQLAWAGSLIGNWSYFVALAIYAYDQGGAAAVGLVSVIRMLPAAVASPFLAGLADRYPRRLVMVVTDVLRALLMLAAAVTIWQGWSAWVVYVIVALSTVVGTAFRPAQAALLPHLARDPAELTAANVASSTLEAVGAFVGPALGGVLLALTNIETVFAVNALSFIWSALLVLAVRGGRASRPDAAAEPGGAAADPKGGVVSGFKALGASRDLLVLSGLYTAQTLVAGALNVLVVVSALELLDVDASGVGYLNAALGAGGLVGGFVALVLAARGRLAADFGLGIALFGLPLALVGITSSVSIALLALALIGLGNSLVDINALTIMQRAVPDEVLGRVLGVLEGILIGSIGVGGLLAPAVVDIAGIRGALIATGLLLPVPRTRRNREAPVDRQARRSSGTPRAPTLRRPACAAAGGHARGARRSARRGVVPGRDGDRAGGRGGRSLLRDRGGGSRGGRPATPARRRLRRDRVAARRPADGHGDGRDRRCAARSRA